MDLDQLRALVAVAEAGSITKAARTLHITQPALSVKLKGLEQDLGVVLFDRGREGVVPTQSGQMLLDTARRVLDLCDSVAHRLRPCGTPLLNVGATPTLGGYVLPHVMGRLIALEPGVKVGLTVTHMSRITEQVLDGRLHMGFVEGPLEAEGLASEGVGGDELRLVASPRLVHEDRLEEAQAYRLPTVLCIPQCGMRQVLERHLAARGRSTAQMSVVAEVDSLEAVKALVEGGAGVAWLSPRAVQREVQVGTLRLVNVSGVRIPYPYAMIFPAAAGVCIHAQRYANLVREGLRAHRRRIAVT